MGTKSAEFDADFKSLEKSFKKGPKTCAHSTKKLKKHKSFSVTLIIFCSHFLATFSTESESFLKVPKREIFVTELFILSDPIWVGDLRTEPKKTF
jgi:hypothetical protein